MLSIVIQAGGESRRMGRDKGLVPFLGQPLISRVASRVARLADELLVTTNHPDSYLFLNCRLVPDEYPGRGALGGLYTAISAARNELVAVIACDMPFASPALLSAQRDLLVKTGCDAVIPQTAEGSEPFHAVYRRDVCLPAIQAAIAADRWRVNSWYPQVNICLMPVQEIELYDPQQLAFWNINTPEELQQAEEIARNAGQRS